MSNQLSNKAAALSEILAANKLTKTASQKIKHISALSQKDLGREMTQEIHSGIDGVNADTEAATNPVLAEEAQELPGVQPLNRSAESALNSTGTKVETMTTDGKQVKTAALYRRQLAGIMSEMNKQAALQNDFRTGTEVLRKFASLTPRSTEEDIQAAQSDLVKLASTNPVFDEFRNMAIMRKLAADITDLADAEGISEEQAANELQAAADANPEMLEEVGDEATGEAVADLADAEAGVAELQGGIEQMAANASANLGTEVTPEDIVQAAEVVQEMADEMGVPAEALIAQAVEEMQAADGDEPTPEEMDDAQQILDAAAEQGISPEEVIQIAAGELEGGEGAVEEMPKEAGCCGRKRKALKKKASVSTRVAYVQSERNKYN